MNIPVFGNDELFISSNKTLYNKDMLECTPTVSNNKISIKIHGVMENVDLDWLWYTSAFRCKLTKVQYRSINNIYYIHKFKTGLINSLPVEMKFRFSIEYKKGYRYVPNYTNMAVSEDGKVINTVTGKSIVPPVNKDYPTISIMCPVKERQVNVKVHRLVAMAWIPNDDPRKWQVNHKDGNKYNPRKSNLEWVTPSENNLHANRTGLKLDGTPVKVMDYKEWKEHHFITRSDAARFLNSGVTLVKNILNKLRPNYLYKGRYDIKLKSDTSDWFYKKGDRIGLSRYVITVEMSRTDIRSYYDVYHVKQDLGIWNVSGITELIAKGIKMYPGAKFSYVDNFPVKKIQCLTISTGEIETADTIMYFSKKHNLSKGLVRGCLLKGEDSSINGFAFRYMKSGKWNASEFNETVPLGRCIFARNVSTKVTNEFKSLRAAAKFFKVDRSVITGRINTNNLYLDEWLFEDVK